jgi:Putative adhesin
MYRIVSVALLTTFAAPALAQRGDFHWDKALAAGSEVSIHNINGDVKVVPSTTGRVEVTGVKRGNSDYFDRIKAVVQESSRGISVCVLNDDADSYCDDGGSHSHSRGDRDWHNVSMDLQIAVPANVEVSAGSVSGNVEITGAHGDVSASSVSGDIKLMNLHASSVQANSVSGNVDVRVDELTGAGAFSFHSVSGDVTLEVPRDFGADLTMSTVSGDINSDFPITLGNGRMSRRSLSARIGAGGRRLDVSTVSGDLRLRQGSR